MKRPHGNNQNRWTNEEIFILVDLLKSGALITEITKKIPSKSRSAIFKQAGRELINDENNLYRPWNQKDEAALKSLTRQGFGHLRISQLLKRTRSSVSNRCFELGISHRHKWTQENDIDLKQKVFEEKTLPQIVEEMGIKERAIRYQIEKQRLKLKRGGKFIESYSFKEKFGKNEITSLISKRINSARKRSIIEKIPFNLTREYLLNIFNKQQGKCFYTGEIMTLTKAKNRNEKYNTVISLDKQDPKKGYIIGNVVFCCDYVNIMKRNYTNQEFVEICSLILNHSKNTTCVVDYQI